MGTKPARTLILVPIIHSPADMGTLAPSVRRVTVQKIGQQGWERNVDVIRQMWADISQAVEGWELPWATVRLYQDGLPRCGRESEIVKELAGAGSPNHQILLKLMHKGATLMGTESPDLLLQEYRLVKHLLAMEHPEAAAKAGTKQSARSRSLLARRDRDIAECINTSLRPSETGILFLGMLHSVEPHLARDIHVTHPIRQLQRARRQRV